MNYAFFWPNTLFFSAHYSLIYSTYYINVRNLYNTEQYNLINTTVSRFTRDILINAHDAYMTVEFYNNYYICVILHAHSRMLQVLMFIKALKECSE